MPTKLAPSTLRYLCFAGHTVLALVNLLVAAIATGWLVLFITDALSTIALLMYVPAAVILSARDSDSSFDHAGGEVAYLVVQVCAALTSTIVSLLVWIVSGLEGDSDSSTGAYGAYIALTILSALHLVLLLGWMGWIIHLARPNLFKVPAHRLITGATRSGLSAAKEIEEEYWRTRSVEGGAHASSKGDVEAREVAGKHAC